MAQFSETVLIKNPERFRGKWRDLFENQHPLAVELGAGKGQFLTQMALLHPEDNFLGLEVQTGVLYYTACKIAVAQATNARAVLANIDEAAEIFAPGEINRLYLNFCDPWPKKRHAKRRLTHPRFLGIYRQVLVPGGELHFKTDNEDLFRYSLETLREEGWAVRDITFDLHGENVAGNVMTEYEEKFSARGKKICRCVAANV